MNGTLKNFVKNIDELGELLDKPMPSITVGAKDLKNNKIKDKSVAKDIFIEFRKILNEKGQSYSFIIKELKKTNLSEEKKKWLESVSACAQKINNDNYSPFKFQGLDAQRNITNIESFLELQSTYITHSDRRDSPIKRLIPNDIPSDQHYHIYLTQTLLMVKAYFESFLYYMKEFCEEVLLNEC